MAGIFAFAATTFATPYGDGINALNRRQYEEAARFFSQAIALNFQAEESLWYRAEIRALQGRRDEAYADCDRLKQLLPKSPSSLLARARVSQLLRDDAGVERNLRAVIAAFPNSPNAYNVLAWRLATNPSDKIRNGRESLRLAQRGCELTRFERSDYLDTLAAAYAEVNNWPEAVRFQRDAIERRKRFTQGSSKTLEEMTARLHDFESARSYRKAPELVVEG